MLFRSLLPTVGMLAFGTTSVAGQDLPWWKKTEHWCIRHSLAEGQMLPCNELSHSAVAFVVTEASFLAGIDGWDGWAACVPSGVLAIGKEALDIGRWGLAGQVKSTLLDLTFSAGGCVFARWLNRGKNKNRGVTQSSRVSFFVGWQSQSLGVRLRM